MLRSLYISAKGARRFFSTRKASLEDYRPSRRGKFVQNSFQLENPWLCDSLLQTYLKRCLPNEVFGSLSSDLEQFGDRIVSEVDGLGRDCELNPPKLNIYDAWGNRVDQLLTCQAWRKMHDISAEEGLIALGYNRKEFGEYARLYQSTKLLLFAPSSGLYSCPLAMTDGAVKLIQSVPHDLEELRIAESHLLSRDPSEFWTSGQWMTEKGGGSDVAGGCDSYAVQQSATTHKLYGYKWFSSATDSDIAFTLAREMSENGEVGDGTSGLTLFYLRTHDLKGRLNNMEIHKLKDKLGTRQLPTAELLLDGTVAHRVGEPGRGVASISPMLTITRIHNAISAVGVMRRILQLSKDFAAKRKSFGKLLKDHPLHVQTLARMEVELRGCQLFLLELCRLLGLEECNKATSEQLHLLRMLTPILKLYTAKQAVPFVSEGLESFGGQGYIEETGLPALLRDGQVLPIWEGTTNILSLDVLRAIAKSNNQSMDVFMHEIEKRMGDVEKENLKEQANMLSRKCSELERSCSSLDMSGFEVAARDFAFSLAHLYIGMLLIEQADSPAARPSDVTAAIEWCGRPLPLLSPGAYSQQVRDKNSDLLGWLK